MNACRNAVAAGMAVLVSAGILSAGTFRAVEVWYVPEVYTDSVLVIVGGAAVYRGAWDSNDNQALIQTTAYDNRPGSTGNTGSGFNKNGPFWDGYRLPCTDDQNGCPGRRYIPRNPCNWTQYSYWGKTAVTIYHQFSPEIDFVFGPSNPVPCVQTHPPPCLGSPQGVEMALPVVGGPQVAMALEQGSFPLSRTDERDGFRYLMEEWAVLAVDKEANGRVSNVEALAASSTAYGAHRSDNLLLGIEESEQLTAGGQSNELGRASLTSLFQPGRSILLAVNSPAHPHNARWIPLPSPRLRSEGWVSTAATPARVIVRADFGEDRSLIGFEVLHADRRLTGRELYFLEHNLALEYASEQRHRAVLFAVLRLGDEIELERGRVVLPQCCCLLPGPGCPPNPPQLHDLHAHPGQPAI